jgi:hypothetical protein
MAVSWLKKGNDSKQAAAAEVVKQEMQKDSMGKMFRFSMKKEEKGVLITFVDGELDKDGFLVPPRYYEHNLFLNNKWGNTFVCPQLTAPHLGQTCPICATAGTKPPALVSVFTVIDHRTVESSKTPGKVYKDMPRLFIAKAGTMEILNHIALKRGGLAGCTFEVLRIGAGDKLPSVGTNFEFEKKTPLDELVKQYMREFVDPKTNQKTMKSVFVPADYDNEIKFHTADELVKLGFGSPQISGYSPGQSMTTDMDPPGGTDYASQL